MKKIICVLLVAFIFVACGRKDGEKRVGDIIMVGGEFGVVYAVTTDGQHGKVVSVIERNFDWKTAKQWCAQYGRGWQMPSQDDLLEIYRKSEVLSSSLRANGYTYTRLSDLYWSSAEYSSDCAWLVDMDFGSSSTRYKNYCYYVRAVSTF